MKEIKEIQHQLLANAKESNKAFSGKMIPGTQKIYGVKTPVLNEIARQYQEHSFALAEKLWHSGSMEEKIIAIKIMEKKGKDDPNRLLKLFQQCSVTIDNWAVCDGLGMQFIRGIVKTHRDEIFSIAVRYSKSANL